MMDESILVTVKKILGLPSDHTEFDLDIITFTNTALATFSQITTGVPLVITDGTAVWSDLVTKTPEQLELAKSFVSMKVRLAFDPPQLGYLVEAINKQLDELAWRLEIENNNERIVP